mgnify:CR=1 FL=1
MKVWYAVLCVIAIILTLMGVGAVALAVLVACEDTVYATLNGAMRSMPHGLISGTVYHMMFERRLGYDDRKCVANMEAFLKDPGLPGVVL